MGGFDVEGRLTNDPAAIEASERPLPIGFWKGSGLALLLDMIAALLSGGHATYQVPARPEEETGLSQVFIAFNMSSFGEPDVARRMADQIIEHLQAPSKGGGTVRYPGQRTLEIRRQNLESGIPVEPSVWQQVLSLEHRSLDTRDHK